jgi:diguanylate cyclase (GGDEF)-like protein
LHESLHAVNVALIPDALAVTALMCALSVLRGNPVERGVRLWLTALFFILFQSIALVFNPGAGSLYGPLHTLSLEALLAAGSIFVYSAQVHRLQARAGLLSILLHATGPALFLAAFGFEVESDWVYFACAGIGLLGAAIAWYGLRLPNRSSIAAMLSWVPVFAMLLTHHMHEAAYLILFSLYAWVALAFWRSLPDGMGRLAMSAGFATWAICFLIHPIMSHHPKWNQPALEILDMQKFLVMTGMLMVLLERQVKENREMALHDRLTGLANRRLFDDRMTTALAYCRRTRTRCALYLIDLNYFKQVNDTLGHDAGDLLLQHVAKNLKAVLRETDTVARIGGDEFTVLAAEMASMEAAIGLQQTLDAALAEPVILLGRSYTISGSIGMAVFPDDAQEPGHLQRCADRRMYQQKYESRSTPSYDAEAARNGMDESSFAVQFRSEHAASSSHENMQELA